MLKNKEKNTLKIGVHPGIDPGGRFTNDLSAKKFVSSFLRTVCVSQTPSTYEILKDFAKIFLNIVVTLRQGGGDLIFQKIS